MQSTPEIEKRMSWLAILAGLLPFVLLGPLLALMPYQPAVFRIDSAQVVNLLLVLTAAGSAVGWVRRFPPWSYSYLVLLAWLLLLNGFVQIAFLFGFLRSEPMGHLIMLFFFCAVIVMAVVLAARWLAPLRHLSEGIRHDWTRLSFGLLTWVAFAVSFYGGDHPPPLGPGVLLPPLMVVLSAGLYLLGVTQRQRVLALLLPPALFLLRGLADGSWPGGLFLMAIILSPALLAVLPRGNRIIPA